MWGQTLSRQFASLIAIGAVSGAVSGGTGATLQGRSLNEVGYEALTGGAYGAAGGALGFGLGFVHSRALLRQRYKSKEGEALWANAQRAAEAIARSKKITLEEAYQNLEVQEIRSLADFNFALKVGREQGIALTRLGRLLGDDPSRPVTDVDVETFTRVYEVKYSARQLNKTQVAALMDFARQTRRSLVFRFAREPGDKAAGTLRRRNLPVIVGP